MNLSLYSVLELGLIYSFVAMGVYLTFRIINFPDLTVDGSFPLGAAIAAALIVHGVSPPLATVVAFFGGLLAGFATGFLHVRLKMLGLLASILVMSALYSINIRIMGQPNIALINAPTIFTHLPSVVVIGILLILAIGLLHWFMKTQLGLSIRTVGSNPSLAAIYGIQKGWLNILILALSNGLVALAGALFAQSEGFADVSLGIGTIIIGLASLLIGEAMIKTHSVTLNLIACMIGAFVYRFLIAVALNLQVFGLQPSDLNLISAVLVTIAVIIPLFYSKRTPHD